MQFINGNPRTMPCKLSCKFVGIFISTSKPLQPDGCKPFVLISFLCVKEASNFFYIIFSYLSFFY